MERREKVARRDGGSSIEEGGGSKEKEQYGMGEDLVHDWETGNKKWNQVRKGTVATGKSLL